MSAPLNPYLDFHATPARRMRIDPFAFAAPGGGGTAYRYYRVISSTTPGAYAFLIRDIELFAASSPPGYQASPTSDLTYGLPQNTTYFFHSSGADSSIKPWYAFDDADNQWYSGAAGGDPGPFVGVDLQTAAVARSANVRTDGDFTGGQTLYMQGSNDFTSWTTLASAAYGTSVATYPLSW